MTKAEITKSLRELNQHFQANADNKNTKLVFFHVQAALGNWLREIDAVSLKEADQEVKLTGPVYY